MLADWTRCVHRHVAWLSLDAGDNDPVRFWRHVVAALDRARQGIAERGGPLLGPPAPSVFEGLVTALINELAAQPSEDEVLLVIEPPAGQGASQLANVPAAIPLGRAVLAQLCEDAEGAMTFGRRNPSRTRRGRVDAGIHHSRVPGPSRVATRPPG
jgi:hypothetical protein